MQQKKKPKESRSWRQPLWYDDDEMSFPCFCRHVANVASLMLIPDSKPWRLWKPMKDGEAMLGETGTANASELISLWSTTHHFARWQHELFKATFILSFFFSLNKIRFLKWASDEDSLLFENVDFWTFKYSSIKSHPRLTFYLIKVLLIKNHSHEQWWLKQQTPKTLPETKGNSNLLRT